MVFWKIRVSSILKQTWFLFRFRWFWTNGVLFPNILKNGVRFQNVRNSGVLFKHILKKISQITHPWTPRPGPAARAGPRPGPWGPGVGYLGYFFQNVFEKYPTVSNILKKYPIKKQKMETVSHLSKTTEIGKTHICFKIDETQTFQKTMIYRGTQDGTLEGVLTVCLSALAVGGYRPLW